MERLEKCNEKILKRSPTKCISYTHIHTYRRGIFLDSRKEKPWFKWIGKTTRLSRRVPSSFCFSPCPFLCRLLACKDMANLVSWWSRIFSSSLDHFLRFQGGNYTIKRWVDSTLVTVTFNQIRSQFNVHSFKLYLYWLLINCFIDKGVNLKN